MRIRVVIILVGMGILLFSPQWSGAQWERTGGPEGGTEGGRITALAVCGTNLFAGTFGDGVFLSMNNGKSWRAVNSGLTNRPVYCLAVSGTNLFAGTLNGGIFLSTNNGKSWKEVRSGLPKYAGVLDLAVIGTNIFAGTRRGLFMSTNNGKSWTAANSGLPNHEVQCLGVSGENLIAGTSGAGVWRLPLSDLSIEK